METIKQMDVNLHFPMAQRGGCGARAPIQLCNSFYMKRILLHSNKRIKLEVFTLSLALPGLLSRMLWETAESLVSHRYAMSGHMHSFVDWPTSDCSASPQPPELKLPHFSKVDALHSLSAACCQCLNISLCAPELMGTRSVTQKPHLVS